MRKKIIYLLSAIVTIAFTIALVSIISGFLKGTTFEENSLVLEENQTVERNGANVRVTNIIYAPCPEGSQCIWSGLAATFVVERSGVKEERQLMEGGNESINGVQIELLEVHPDTVRVTIYGM